MIAYVAGDFAVLTAGARAFVISNTITKRNRVVSGEDAAALAIDVINRPAAKRLPDEVAAEYLAGFFKHKH